MDLPEPWVGPTPRWIRVRDGDTVLADSRRASLLAWYGPPPMLPTYLFPEEDVRTDLLEDRHGARRMSGLEGPAAAGNGLWTFPWDGAVQWFEEATQVVCHARDPTKRVDVVPSERHVQVTLNGTLLANTTRPSALFESWLPTRWYIPREDVAVDLLEPSDLRSICPYKGRASYFHVTAGGERHENLAWTYPEPIPECPGVRDLICFFQERVDLTVDGDRLERPITPWSLTPDA